MSERASYRDDKEKRAEIAREHTKDMQTEYNRDIHRSISKSVIYNGVSFADKEAVIIIEDIDTVGAIVKYGDLNTAVLNFASYNNPGGMFLKGSKTQEDCLCHESFLYNVLKEFQIQYYDWNNRNKNKSLYTDRALYSPKIYFFRDNKEYMSDVITCAAPNKFSAQKYYGVSEAENRAALESRIKFVLDVAKDNGVSTLILGAFGCGVFGQDATEVANIFKNLLETTHKCFDRVVFAIPNKKRNSNHKKFVEVFQEDIT